MDKMTNGQAIFTWVHLADLHHRAGGLRHGNEPRLMLAELEHDVLRLVKKNWCPQPDAVFVSGDIAFSGGGLDGEYEAAQRWLLHLSRSLSLSPKSVFVVPGNHDVQRTEDRTPGVQRLIRALRHGDLSFEQLLNDTQARQLFERRFAAYLHFAAKFAPQNFAQPTPGDGLCFWSCPFSARGLSAQLVGLNTELLSSIEDNRNQPPLRSTPLSLNFFPSLKSASDGNCTIILGHHPINEDWLAGEIPITEIVRNRSGIYLCGHSHGESNIIRYSLNNHEIIQISAGACWRQVNHQELLEFRYNLVAIVSSESG